MGFWNTITNLASKGYESIRHGLGLVWSPVKSAVNFVTNVVNKFDNFLGTYLNDVPYIGALVNQVRENPSYKEAIGAVNSVQAGMGRVEQAARDIDAIISPFVQGGRSRPEMGIRPVAPVGQPV